MTISPILFFDQNIKIGEVHSYTPDLSNSEGKTIGEVVGNRTASLEEIMDGPSEGDLILSIGRSPIRSFIQFREEE